VSKVDRMRVGDLDAVRADLHAEYDPATAALLDRIISEGTPKRSGPRRRRVGNKERVCAPVIRTVGLRRRRQGVNDGPDR
jgi:hypothetical protein